MLYTADFETTTDPEDCRVWAWAICEIGNPENITIGNTMESFFEMLRKHGGDTFYFHNLKFDGEFIVSHCLNMGLEFCKDKELPKGKFKTLISDAGQWYSVDIFLPNTKKQVHFIDSLKIIPLSIEAIPKAFGLADAKLKIDYTEKREKGHILTEEEIAYIKEDVVIAAKAMYIMRQQGLNKITAGSNALADFKARTGKKTMDALFPFCENDHDIRLSYRGGFTYLKPEYADKDIGEGIVLDVNSLYPYVMHEFKYPYGPGVYFEGKYKPDANYPLFVQCLTCQFELKPKMIPTIQMKQCSFFLENEYCTSSKGEELTIVLTSVDLKLFLEHYEVYNIEYKGGWKYKGKKGMFADYIDYWIGVKNSATREGNKGMRTLAKLMLNSLYGKFATKPETVSTEPVLVDGILRIRQGNPEPKKPLYIPVGTFVTAYARNVTIRAAQSVYDRFVYADTDSLHLIGTELPKGLNIDPVELGAWKHESSFRRARFIRQKTYIEDEGTEESPDLKVTCCGMPKQCHQYVTWENFHPGAVYQGKLRPRHVPGGIVLEECEFTVRIPKNIVDK